MNLEKILEKVKLDVMVLILRFLRVKKNKLNQLIFFILLNFLIDSYKFI